MVVRRTDLGYSLDLSANEREALLVALELAVGYCRREPEIYFLAASVEADALDTLADRLMLGGEAA